jgi:hypothetical protein
MTEPPSGPPPGPVSPNAPTQSLPLTGAPPEYPGSSAAPGAFAGPEAAGPGGPHFPAPPHPDAASHTAVWVLGLVGLVATVIGLSVKEDGHNFWDSVNAWGGLAILGALLTLAPVLRSALNLSAHRAWQVAAAGAGALGLFWVLFVLPAAGSNTSLITTIGAAAGVAAVWAAPGREADTGPQPQVW